MTIKQAYAKHRKANKIPVTGTAAKLLQAQFYCGLQTGLLLLDYGCSKAELEAELKSMKFKAALSRQGRG